MLAQRWQWAWVCLSICLLSATDRSWCVSARSWAVAASLSAPSALKPTHRGHAQIQAKSPLRWDSTCRPIHAALCPPCPLKVGFGQVPQPSKQSNKSAKPRRAKAAAILAKPNCRYPWTPAIIGLALARPRSISHISGSACAVTMVPANSPTYRDFLHPLVAPWSTQTERSRKMCIG